MSAFTFDANAGEDSSTARKRRLAEAMLQQGMSQQKIDDPWQGVAQMANAFVGGMGVRRADARQKADDQAAMASIMGGSYTPPKEQPSTMFDGLKDFLKSNKLAQNPGQQTEVASLDPTAGMAAPQTSVASEMPPIQGTMENARTGDRNSIQDYAGNTDAPGGDVFNGFMNTVKGKVTNPYGLAAIAATGKAESGYSPKRANSSWSDPSQSGQAGQSGGILSWRNERLHNLYNYAASKGEKQGAISPQTQAEYFLNEDPNLINSLNNAKSTEEAQSLMNNAWKFAGYNQQGGESSRRLGYANSFLPTFQGQSSAGPQTATDAIEAQMRPVEVASNEQSIGVPADKKQQLAEALQGAPQQSQSPVMQNPKVQELMQVMMNPNVSSSVRNMAGMKFQMMQQEQAQGREEQQWRDHQKYEQDARQNDPLYQQNLEKGKLEIEQARNPSQKSQWAKLDDGTLYNQITGETKRLSGDEPQGFRFSGNSTEASALNGLIESGQLTPEQAMQIAAGKQMTGPNGEVMFATPQAIIGGQGGQGGAMNDGGIDLFGGEQPTQKQTMPTGGQDSGMIQLTQPRVTESEKNAMTYADRMGQSGSVLDKMGTKGTSTTDQMLNDYLPFGLGNYATSDDFKTVDQAKRDFINSQLRRESGAAISPTEFQSADKQYFPQPGDTPEVIEQKKKNRQTVTEGMIRDAGPTYKRPKGENNDNGNAPSVDDLLKKYGG